MKTIKCIKEVSKEYICTSVTIGKSYKVIKEFDDDYLITDDKNEERQIEILKNK